MLRSLVGSEMCIRDRKGTKFTCTQAAEEAFLDLKSCLSTQPVLRPPDYSLPFCLTVDASDLAVGATLFQLVENIEHPVCFYSKKLDIHQQRYSTIEKEALGLVLAVRYFSVYFGTGVVTVYTDHNPLLFYSGWPTTIRNCCVGVWNSNSITLTLCIVLVKTICCLTY